MTASFPLAPMSRGIGILTGVLLGIPLLLLALAWSVPGLSVFSAVAAAMVALYAAIWIWWRPTGFEVSPEGLRIRFPGRSRLLPARDLAGARPLASGELRSEVGLALRIGVGGLWGGFGWLWTQHRGLVEFYVSRLDGLVWIERHGGRPLLVSPADPSGLVRALTAP
jgi:hypothetical protein